MSCDQSGRQKLGDPYGLADRGTGGFPGGVVDLRFQFTLDGDRIAELVIES